LVHLTCHHHNHIQCPLLHISFLDRLVDLDCNFDLADDYDTHLDLVDDDYGTQIDSVDNDHDIHLDLVDMSVDDYAGFHDGIV